MSLCYPYLCEECNFQFEAWQRYNEEKLTDCPECGQSTLRRLFNTPTIYVREVKTVGQQAELNARREGSERLQMMAEEAKDRARSARERGTPLGNAARKIGGVPLTEKGEKPWWREGAFTGKPLDRPLNLDKVRDTEHYIMTGEGANQ